jgi:pyrimidine nucleoside transport protein
MGLYIQFVLGLIIIRWSVGRSIFQCLGNKVATFLSYSDAGSSFVYGNMLIDSGVFAFKVCIQKTVLS